MRKTLIIFFFCLFACSSNSLAVDAPTNVRIASGGGGDTSLPVPRGDRTGVAPLSVQFSAGLTESTPEAQPFHNYEYSWDFGDPNSGTWGTSGKSKNTDKGPVAAHVYEAAGTYTAILTIRDGSRVVSAETFTVTVTNPDTVYSGTKTTCINNSGDSTFTGCPSGANQVQTNSLSTLTGYADSGERILLKRGGSWTVSSNISWPRNSGPVHIGAYGTCSNPDELGICSNAPAVSLGNGVEFIQLDSKRDWRLTDITFTGSKSSDGPRVISGATGIKDLFVYKVKTTGMSASLGWSHWRNNDSDYLDNNAIVSCRVTDFYTYGIYVGAERLALLGNIVQNSSTTHAVRAWQAYGTVIAHNIFSGSSLDNTAGRHALKLHGNTPYGLPNGETYVGTYSQTGGGGLRSHSQFIVISNNVFGSSGPWPVALEPQNAALDERVSDLLFEKNRVVADYGLKNNFSITNPVIFSGRYITARNNIINPASTDGLWGGICIIRRGVEWTPLWFRAYNNTIYNSSASLGSYAYGFYIDSATENAVIINNYVSFPNYNGSKAIANNQAGGQTTLSNNVLTNTPYFVDPNNASPLARNFDLTSSATQAIGQGATIPVFDDFAGNTRITPYDVGAFSF